MNYYIYQHDVKKDGGVNVTDTSRSTYALALAYFYGQCRSAAQLSADTFASSHLRVTDGKFNVLDAVDIDLGKVANEGAEETEATE